MAVRAQGHAAAQVHLLQRGRERAGDLQGPRADGAQSAPDVRGLPDRLLGDRGKGCLHLHPRGVLPRPEGARGGAGQGLRAGLRREEHHGDGVRLRYRHPSRRGRLRSRGRDRSHRIARRQARTAPDQAAVPRRIRSLQLPDRGEQRRDALQPALHPAERRRVVHQPWSGEERRAQAVLRQRAREETGHIRSVDEYDAARADLRPCRRNPGRSPAEGDHSGRVLGSHSAAARAGNSRLL